MNKRVLIIYRLFDKKYTSGNPLTLMVSQDEHCVLHYSLYGGHQYSGIGHHISNIGLKTSLPMTVRVFANVRELDQDIQGTLATGYGSHDIKEREILNEIGWV